MTGKTFKRTVLLTLLFAYIAMEQSPAQSARESSGKQKKAGTQRLISPDLKLKLTPKIYAAMSIHVEGFGECPLVLENGNTAPTLADCNRETSGRSLSKYNSHFANLIKMTDIFVDGGRINLPLSLEFEENFLTAAKVHQEFATQGARLDLLNRKGHSLSPHGDAHGYYAGVRTIAGLGQSGIESHFAYLRDTLLDPSVQRSVSTTNALSGVCAAGNWLKAAEALGFDTITGLVSFCLTSLPAGSVPAGDIPSSDPAATLSSTCTSPGACHATYPYLWYDPSATHPITGTPGAFDIQHPTRPWRTDSRFRFMGTAGQPLWTASVSSGATAMVPGIGSLYCLAEKKPASGATIARWESETHCDFCEDDLDVYFEILDQTLAESGVILPRVIATVYSLGTAVSTTDSGCSKSRAELLRSFTQRLQRDYVNTGKVQWVTLPELGGKVF